MNRNIFVLGLDLGNLESLLSLPPEYQFQRLLSIERLQQGETIPFDELLAEAVEHLESFDGRIDAIVGYWDFPISSMVPILAARFGVPGASLESVVKCEHKYWCRLEQEKVIDEYPRFTVVDPERDALDHLHLEPPYWIKPFKAFSSELAYRIDALEDLRCHLREVCAKLRRIAEPFEAVLSRLDLPPEIAEVGAMACIAEEAAVGRQVTVEGFRTTPDSDVVVYGVIDSHLHPEVHSFERYEYPSMLPEHVQARMADVSRRIIERVGLCHSTFNIEFFWDEETDRITVLEVNPRHSQSHARLFALVDGVPNHRHMVDLGLGREPQLVETGDGPYRRAAKWFLRHLRDGVVTRSPGDDEVAAAERAVAGTAVHVIAREGVRLSELWDQDSYSYKVANVFTGGDSPEELREKFERVTAMLPFAVDDTVTDDRRARVPQVAASRRSRGAPGPPATG